MRKPNPRQIHVAGECDGKILVASSSPAVVKRVIIQGRSSRVRDAEVSTAEQESMCRTIAQPADEMQAVMRVGSHPLASAAESHRIRAGRFRCSGGLSICSVARVSQNSHVSLAGQPGGYTGECGRLFGFGKRIDLVENCRQFRRWYSGA